MAKAGLSSADLQAAKLAAQERAPSPSMEPVMGGFLGAVAAGAVVMVYQAVARIPVGQNFWAEVVVALIGFGIGYFVVRERWNEHARVYQEELEKRRERSNA